MSAIKVIFVYGNSKYGVLLPSSQSKNSITQNTKKARLPGTAQKTFLLSGSKSFIASLPSLLSET